MGSGTGAGRAVAAAVVALLLIGGAWAADPPALPARALAGRGDAVFSTRTGIEKLAANGNRAAVVTTGRRTCGPNANFENDRVVVWTAPGRRSTSFGMNICQYEDGVSELALGGGDVVWIAAGGGNTLELGVFAAKLPAGRAKQVDGAVNGDRAGGDPTGDWVGRLFGGGALLGYNRWTAGCGDPPPGYSCSDFDPSLRITDTKLVLVSAGRPIVVKSGPESYPLVAVGGRRMAVEMGGALTVLEPSGSPVASVPATPGNAPRAIALTATRLAVTRTSTLDLYDAANGAEAKSIPLGSVAALELAGLTAKLALLAGPRRLVAMRLTDGKLVRVPTGTARLVGARLTTAGLFYAYNTRRGTGRIVFEPTERLLARF